MTNQLSRPRLSRGTGFALSVAFFLVLAGGYGGWALSEQPKPAPKQSGPMAEQPRALSAVSREIYDTKVKPFLKAHCIKCHNEEKTLKNFRIDNLGTDFLDHKTGDNWNEIRDRILLDNRPGAMPPAKEPRPDPKEAAAVADWIIQELTHAEMTKKHSIGLTRRMNRTEYGNTLRDLFDIDENYLRPLVEKELSPDGKVDGFDRGGASLFIDQAQLAKYYELAERVLSEQVFAQKPAFARVKNFAKDIKWPSDSQGGKFIKVNGLRFVESNDKHPVVTLPRGASMYELKNGGIEYLATPSWFGLAQNSLGSGAEGPWDAGGGRWTDKVHGFLGSLKQEGLYRMRLRAGAFAGKGKFAVENVKVTFTYGGRHDPLVETRIIDAPVDNPKDYVIELYMQPGKPGQPKGGHLYWNGVHSSGPRLRYGGGETGLILEYPELLKRHSDLLGELLRTEAEEKKKGTPPEKIPEIFKAKAIEVQEIYDKCLLEYAKAGKPKFIYNPEYDLGSIPRLWLESWEIEGPLVEWPSKGRKNLFFDGEDRPIDEKYIWEILARFLPRAYRRAVETKEIDAVAAWVHKVQQKHNLSRIDAVKEGIKAVLCSPDFLLITQVQESAPSANKPRPLTDYELASRLSYFLWSTMPDDQLFDLAAKNQLHIPETLAGQVRRMIADEKKGMGLVRDFTGQWLQVRDFHKTMTDRNLYKSYTDEVRNSSWQEPYEFFKEILRKDLSILNFVDSDFLVIDKTLAEHYGMKGVVKDGEGFKTVAIRPDQHRGGVLGMAGVLTYLSDGLRTMPVRRAAYVMDVLWHEPPKPPPPNAGDLPALKGNLTVRQRLDLHRNSDICGSCHRTLDPFGVALENYDAIGLWRERPNGQGYSPNDKNLPFLDVSGELPSGRQFKNLEEYKQALLADKEKQHFIRGFTKKMLTYALGRSVGGTDRETIEGIVRAIERDNYRMQSLVQAIVASEAFRMK